MLSSYLLYHLELVSEKLGFWEIHVGQKCWDSFLWEVGLELFFEGRE